MKKNRGLSLMIRCCMYVLVLLMAGAWFPGGLSRPALAQNQVPGGGTGQGNTPLQGSGEAGSGAVKDSQKSKPTLYGIDVQEYIRKRYAVVGPCDVTAVSATALQIFTGQNKPLSINLVGKKVKVLDTSGNQLTLSDVKKYSRVLVLTKGTEVLIYVLPARKERKNV